MGLISDVCEVNDKLLIGKIIPGSNTYGSRGSVVVCVKELENKHKGDFKNVLEITLRPVNALERSVMSPLSLQTLLEWYASYENLKITVLGSGLMLFDCCQDSDIKFSNINWARIKIISKKIDINFKDPCTVLCDIYSLDLKSEIITISDKHDYPACCCTDNQEDLTKTPLLNLYSCKFVCNNLVFDGASMPVFHDSCVIKSLAICIMMSYFTLSWIDDFIERFGYNTERKPLDYLPKKIWNDINYLMLGCTINTSKSTIGQLYCDKNGYNMISPPREESGPVVFKKPFSQSPVMLEWYENPDYREFKEKFFIVEQFLDPPSLSMNVDSNDYNKALSFVQDFSNSHGFSDYRAYNDYLVSAGYLEWYYDIGFDSAIIYGNNDSRVLREINDFVGCIEVNLNNLVDDLKNHYFDGDNDFFINN